MARAMRTAAGPNSALEEGDSSYVTGVGKLNGRLILLIDLTKVLRGELRRLGEFAAQSVAVPA